MREKTNIYFLAEITRGHGCGDCILLENIDSNGSITHALIDTGNQIYEGVVNNFLDKHKVKKLEFLCITHSHTDHNGDTISVLENFKVNKLIIKEFNSYWSSGGSQDMYEKIIEKAIEKEIKVIGVSFESLGSEEYSPSESENFRNNVVKMAKKENFEFFNEQNINFEFGSADIKILNYQIFDSKGNLFIPGENVNDENKCYRAKYKDENDNSLGILLFQGNKKAFFAGDINNKKKNVGGELIGDEDRLKYEIGKVDLLKLGHHGYSDSNTIDYLNVLLPDYAIITNDIGTLSNDVYNFFEKNNVNYLYSTQDEYEVCAIIYNDEVSLGFGTEGIKNLKFKSFYVPEDKIYSNYLKILCPKDN